VKVLLKVSSYESLAISRRFHGSFLNPFESAAYRWLFPKKNSHAENHNITVSFFS